MQRNRRRASTGETLAFYASLLRHHPAFKAQTPWIKMEKQLTIVEGRHDPYYIASRRAHCGRP